MTETDSEISATLDAALDAALGRALSPPKLPADFRERLRAALVRARDTESPQTQRARLERECHDELAALRNGFLRLGRRTVTALIVGILAIGGAGLLLFPGLNATFGVHALTGVAVFGGIWGLSVGLAASRVSVRY